MSDPFTRQFPQTLILRPLDKGMVLNEPSEILPPGAFLTLEGVIVQKKGLYRRPGWGYYANNDTIGVGEEMIDYRILLKSNDIQIGFVISNLYAYIVSLTTGFTRIYHKESTGTIGVSGVAVTGVGTLFLTNGIKEHDIFVSDPGATGEVSSPITFVGSETTLTIADDLGTITAGTSYEIWRLFDARKPYLVDYNTYLNESIFTTFLNRPVTYNPSTSSMEEYITTYPTTGPFKAGCVGIFGERVWFGNITDNTDGIKKQRLRWSAAGNGHNFSDPLAFLDLDYSSGSMLRIIPLGNSLMIYMTDYIYRGTYSNIRGLPVTFQQIDTGGNGLVGQKALVPWVDGHFYISQDDIYFMTNRGAEPIGSPIVRETIAQCQELWRAYVSVDPVNNRIVFGFPTSHTYIEKIWSFNYKTKAWSFEYKNTYLLASPVTDLDITWNDLTGTWDTLGITYATWDSMINNNPVRYLYAEQDLTIQQLSRSSALDIGISPINVIIETPDYDLNGADRLKTFTRVAIKIQFINPPTATISYIVEASSNEGRDWKSLGILRILQGHDEGYVNFRITGSHVRFRFTLEDTFKPYWITEITFRVRPRGLEFSSDSLS